MRQMQQMQQQMARMIDPRMLQQMGMFATRALQSNECTINADVGVHALQEGCRVCRA
jgi:hypothetical protein